METVLIWFWATFSLFFCKGSVVGMGNLAKFKPSVENTTGVLRISQPWLIDLEKSYELSFPHQFGFLKYTNNLTVPNHNVPRDVESTCGNVSFLSFDQNRRLIQHFGFEAALNSTIKEMLDNPRARLFQFPDHWGEFEDYRASGSQTNGKPDGKNYLMSLRIGICTDLIQLEGRVRSVITFGKCVRLFEKRDCRGWSLAIYPGSSNSQRLELPRHVTLKAIGPCLENEFLGGHWNLSMPGFVVKNPIIRSFQPDLFMIFDPDIAMGRWQMFDGVRVKYLLGTRNRTEIIMAESEHSWFNFHQKTNIEEKDFNKMFEMEDGDVLGHAIPTTIGGPANEAFNIFPTNQYTLSNWEDVSIPNLIIEMRTHGFDLQFEYENENKTRPLFFYYWIRLYGGINYGRFINGQQPNPRRDTPHCQGIPKFSYKGTQKINLSQVLEHNRGNLMNLLSRNTSLQKFNRITDNALANWQSCKQTKSRNDKGIQKNDTGAFRLKTQIRGGNIRHFQIHS